MKKGILLLITFMFCINGLYSQDENVSDFSFGAHFNPKYTIQHFEHPDEAEGDNSFNYSLGADVFFELNDQIMFKSGLNLNRISINQKNFLIIFGSDLDPLNGVKNNDSYIKSENTTYYIGIPIEARYKVLGTDKPFYLNIGVESLFKIGNTKNKTYLKESHLDEREIDSNTLTKMTDTNFKAKLGFGYESKIFSNTIIYLQPQIEYALSSFFEESGASIHNGVRTFDIGLVMGVRF